MTKERFLESLKEKLGFMEKDDIDEALHFYAEMIDDRTEDGLTEEEAVAQIESPDTIAERLRKMTNGEGQKETKEAKEYTENREWQFRTEAYKTDDIHEIELNSRNLPIRIVPGKQEIVLIYVTFTGDKMQYKTKVENGKLTLIAPARTQSQSTFGGLIGSFIKLLNEQAGIGEHTNGAYIKLAVPDSFSGSITAQGTNDKIRVSDLHCRADVQVQTTNAHVTAENCEVDSLSLNTTNARIMLENIKAQDEVNVKSTNGRIEAKKVLAPTLLALETTNGQIRIESCDAADIRIQTSNASVNGLLHGSIADYDIESHTSNGENELGTHPKHNAQKHLRVYTSNASIHFEFQE